MQQSDAIARKVAEIRPRFLAVLAQRLDRFDEILNLLETASDIRPLLEEIRFGAHRTVGLAATLGFHELGALSRTVEVTVHHLTEGNRQPTLTPEVIDAVDDLLAEMDEILHS